MKLWHPPTYIGFQAPVPPPPDYSSPAAVNARIREFCGRAWFAKALSDKAFAQVYGDFRLALGRVLADQQPDEELAAPKPAGGRPCPIEDWHVSKWTVVRGKRGYELAPRDGSTPTKRKRKAA